MKMKVKFKKLNPDAVIPRRVHDTDAGLDLTATSRTFNNDGTVTYGTGLAVEIPIGYVGYLFPRSSICRREIALTNSVGIIDAGYRGEIKAKFRPTQAFDDGGYCHNKVVPSVYNVGDRIAQLIIMPYPDILPVESAQLSPSERGTDGYGSTGI